MNALLIHPAFPPTFWSYKYAIPFIRKKAALPRLTDARPARGCGCADAPLKALYPNSRIWSIMATQIMFNWAGGMPLRASGVFWRRRHA